MNRSFARWVDRRNPCSRTKADCHAAEVAYRAYFSGWWPPELEDCDWLWQPTRPDQLFLVKPVGSGDHAWREPPVHPLDEPPMTV